uniref:CCHC-type domain-containing protein n=1 Tax=Tanacetum cinerariifolium TaxID=118510 RepID=A0A6L2KDW2_TANCI|nr:hypothetical protein [Tanacetum cinerariifolium]
MVAYLSKSDASKGFDQIMDFLNAHAIQYALVLRALIDGKKVVVTEDVIRQDLHLDDADGVECLSNEEIFTELSRMGYEKPHPKLTFYKAFFSAQWKFLIHTLVQCVSAKRTAFNEFRCSMASAIICLATCRKFNFSKYIFDNMVRNVDNPSKFLMYPRFLQVIIDNQVDDLTSHNTKYTSPALTQKVFANMRRVGKEEEKDDEMPIAPALPSPIHTPLPPPQDPIFTPPQAQPATPYTSPPQNKTNILKPWRFSSSKKGKEVREEEVKVFRFQKVKKDWRIDQDVSAATKDVSAAEPTMFDDEEVTMTMAQTLTKMKAKKAKLLDEQIAKRLHDEEIEKATARDKKYQILKRKPISIAQARKNMIIYLKNMAGYKMEHFRDASEPRKKRVAEETLLQESFKKLKAVEVSGSDSTQETLSNDLKEMSEENVQYMLKIVPVFEFKVEALQVNITAAGSRLMLLGKDDSAAEVTEEITLSESRFRIDSKSLNKVSVLVVLDLSKRLHAVVAKDGSRKFKTIMGALAAYLKGLGEYDMWRLRIEQYFQVQDYALWDVIENRNSCIPVAQTTTNADGTSTTLIPGLVTTKEKVQKKNDVKERSMLLMALPNEHQMTFNQYKDAKTLFDAIQTRFGGNEATRKTQKTLLKQMYKNFSASSTDTNEVNTTYGVSTANTQVSPASTQVSTVSTQVSTANLSDATVYAFLSSQPNRKININGSDTAGYDKSKVECFNCHKLGHFARECRLPKNQDSRNMNQDNSRRTVNVEETTCNTMVAIDGASFDWSYMADNEVPTNMALMDFLDSEANCNYYQWERVVTGNNYTRVNYNNSTRKTYPSAHRNIAPRAVLMKTGLRPLNTARPVNTAHPKTTVYSARPMSCFSKSTKSVTARPRAVNTDRPNSIVVNAIRENQINVVKASACWVWRPTKLNSASITLMKHNYVDGHPQKEYQGYVDSGCSRHMTGNMSYLSDFKEFDRVYVTFGGGAKGGKITKILMRRNLFR